MARKINQEGVQYLANNIYEFKDMPTFNPDAYVVLERIDEPKNMDEVKDKNRTRKRRPPRLRAIAMNAAITNRDKE